MINQTEQQERQHLQKVISRLQHYLETLETMVQGKNKELMEHKSYLWDNYSELDRAEKSSLREIVTRSVASGENALEKRKKIRKLISIPYFGRIDFMPFMIRKIMRILFMTGVLRFHQCSMIMNLVRLRMRLLLERSQDV